MVGGAAAVAAVEDRAGGVWVSTFNGLRRVAPPSPVFQHLALPAPGRATRLTLDRQGRILASVFERPPAFPPGLALCALDAYEDADGALWVATFASDGGRGLHRLGRDGSHARYTPDPSDPGTLPHSLLRVLHEDPAGRLWIGTEAGSPATIPPPTASCACKRRTTPEGSSATRRSGP